MPTPSDHELTQGLSRATPAGGPPPVFLARVRARRRAVRTRRVLGVAGIAACGLVIAAISRVPSSSRPGPLPIVSHDPSTEPAAGASHRDASLASMRRAWNEDGSQWLASLGASPSETQPPLRLSDSRRLLAGDL
ncbi:MAG: hypothetical protein IPJ41_17280 [Phycisphaerales bacterium]|nr:hypothetical protein [Phycisphaerales bacterium]